MTFDIPAGPMSTALVRYAEQAKVQLLYTPRLAEGRHVRPLRGRFTALGALQHLLAGSGIAVRQVEPRVFVLSPPTAEAPNAVHQPPSPVATPPSEEIVVTGTHIRGAHPASPTQTITRADVQRSGYNSIA